MGGNTVAYLRSGARGGLPCLIVTVCAVAAYFNSLQGAFVFDDLPNIVNNSAIRQLWPGWENIGPTRRPLLFRSLAINYAIGGLDVWSYHVVNLAVHILAALALMGVAYQSLTLDPLRDRYGRWARGLALAVALIWVVHPLQTQSVTYIIQRGESLMGLFFLLTLYAVLRGGRSDHARRWYLAAVALNICGLATKEVMITCPLVIFLFDATLLSGTVRGAVRRRWPLYLALAAPGMLVAGRMLLNDPAQFLSLTFDADAVTPLQYALAQPGVILHYIRLAVWPDVLCFDYDWPTARSWRDILLPALPIAFLLTTTLHLLYRRHPAALLGASFFLILIPTSSVLPIRDLAVEHRMYLPLAAVVVFAMILGHGLLGRIIAHQPTRGRVALILVGLCVGVLGLLTHARNTDYRTPLSLWTDVVAKRPDNARAHNNLGATWRVLGEMDRAASCYQRALDLRDDYAEAQSNLGVILLHRGQLDAAILRFRSALDTKPNYTEARVNLGLALARQGKKDEARACYREAIRHKPESAVAHNNLGVVWAAEENFEEAMLCFRRAVLFRPGYADAHYNLANVLLLGEKPLESIDHYRAVLHSQPNHAKAHNNLGTALLSAGNQKEAVSHFRQALKLKPGYAAARENLRQALEHPE